ncbi:class I SAM-dependent methyltransferase [Streptomyces sp. CB03911]|uniref:class I SAM-dependent methyltransferase n=1 Tax=Streptomycetaceae TaxID=2062 RepID=UPI00093CD319|nr:class I SAM-dependent methyltransferase [Streptomyces sp. CB03911]OKI29267.1 methyltransferase [Streptomyces sp. CB03911]
MGNVPQEIWEQHYTDGLDFAPLGADELTLLAEHVAAPEGGGRALEVGCGTGELAAHLAATGYTVDALDLAGAALVRARARHQGDGVRWLRLDIEHDDPADLDAAGYDLITLRLVLAFIGDRTRVLRTLGERLRPGGAVVLTTPQAERTPADRRGIALDEDELTLLTAGWASVRRLEAGDLAVLVLRGPATAQRPGRG